MQSVRTQDTPAELLPDENLQEFFPNRLGLSDVVAEQIRQFEELARRKQRVDRSRVEALLKLVARRPDSESVFTAVGRELAQHGLGGLRGALSGLIRHLPAGIRRRATAGALRAARGRTLVAGSLEIIASPLTLRAVDALTAVDEPDGGACRLYGSLLEGVAELYGLEPAMAEHNECQTLGGSACVWEIVSAG